MTSTSTYERAFLTKWPRNNELRVPNTEEMTDRTRKDLQRTTLAGGLES